MVTKKVVIAAAGQGTRMLHLTKNKSKHLIKVCQKPFLSYLLDNILEAGYEEIILVVGYGDELMRDFLKEYDYKVELVNQFEILGPKEKIYGTACPLMCVKDIIKNGQFVYLCGDNLYSARDLGVMNIDDDYCYIAGLEHKNPEKYGVLVEKDGFLEKVVEKSKENFGNIINAGLYKFTPEIFEKVSLIKKSARGEYEITDAINLLAKDKKMKIQIIRDYWMDFGNPSDVIKLSKFIKNGNNKKQ
jgi:dTDP-glucose pyrophosphorylase